MHRTTIMLPHDLKAKAQRRAAERGVSLGVLVRESLAQLLDAPIRHEDPIFSTEAWDGDAPADLAEEHDRYLYGEPEEG